MKANGRVIALGFREDGQYGQVDDWLSISITTPAMMPATVSSAMNSNMLAIMGLLLPSRLRPGATGCAVTPGIARGSIAQLRSSESVRSPCQMHRVEIASPFSSMTSDDHDPAGRLLILVVERPRCVHCRSPHLRVTRTIDQGDERLFAVRQRGNRCRTRADSVKDRYFAIAPALAAVNLRKLSLNKNLTEFSNSRKTPDPSGA